MAKNKITTLIIVFTIISSIEAISHNVDDCKDNICITYWLRSKCCFSFGCSPDCDGI